MSFSGEVKEELLKQNASLKHCVYAELAAIAMFGDGRRTKPDQNIRQKAFTLCKKDITIKVDEEKDILIFPAEFGKERLTGGLREMLRRPCCKRAFLRGAYLCIGSMSNPGKSYHLEFDCMKKERAELLQDLITAFDIPAKIALRKKYYVVYVKEGSAICDILNIMGAHVSLMDFENHRIVKEVRNSINRKVNCETANITKTVNAAAGQVKDIQLIEETCGLDKLPESLQEIARLRLENQEATLQELGEMLTHRVGKSGVNHRLRKLSMIAESMRK